MKDDDDGLPRAGYIRLPSIIGPGAPLPVSRSTFLARVRAGTYPKPVHFGRIAAWDVSAIRGLLATAAEEAK